jgi:HD-GYP domain-containing protein (c-di-GMP phosphodiesterase class II)
MPMDEALGVIRAEAGEQFDPEFVQLLERVVAEQRDRWAAQIHRTMQDVRREAELQIVAPSEVVDDA